MEIAQKIVHAIKRNERFAAYIVLPLHPDTEGFTRCVPILQVACASASAVIYITPKQVRSSSLVVGQSTCAACQVD